MSALLGLEIEMISVYATQIEAVDETGVIIFKLNTFDEYTAELTINAVISPDILQDLFDSIKKGVDLLELKKSA